MKGLRRISIIFIKRSKVLTISCVISVMTAVLLIISMYNFSVNAKKSYEMNLKAAYGDCDMILSYKGYNDISNLITTKIGDMPGIDGIAYGRFENGVSIENYNVYTIGAVDSDMMKSRYHYSVSLSNEDIIINQILAQALNKTVGDSITIKGTELNISQVIDDKTYLANSITIAIMTLETLTKINDNADNANFIMVKLNNIATISEVSERIKGIDNAFDILVIEEDELYKESVETFSIFLIILSIIILIVSSFFVASIFHSFLYKYNHDIAIIRAIGGSKKNVNDIFSFITIIINGIACIIGFFLSILLNNFILQNLNRKLNLIYYDITFYIFQSLIIAFTIFCVIFILLKVSLIKNQKILPIEAIIKNEIKKIGKKKKKRVSVITIPLRKIFGKNVYLAFKLLLPKLKENLFLIFTIMMIVLFSLIGDSLNNLIQFNNSNYLKDQYLADLVVTSNNQIDRVDMINIIEKLNSLDDVKASYVLQNGDDAEYLLDNTNTKKMSYFIADLDTMEDQGIINNLSSEFNQIVLSSEFASDYDIIVGDTIRIYTPPEYITDNNGNRVSILKNSIMKEMIVNAIIPKSKLQYRDALIDEKNLEFIQDGMGMNTIYVSGNLEKADTILSEIKISYQGLKWTNFNEVKEVSSKAIKDRFYIFELVISVLLIISSVGWFNSMRNIIFSRNKEYGILRMQGVTVINIQIIIIHQILIYLLVGILLGLLIGISILSIISYYELSTFLVNIELMSVAKIVIFMLGISILLYPSVIKVSKNSMIKQ